jgi:hypothetical protein
MGAELSLLATAVVQLAIQSVSVRKSLADTVEVLLGHSAVPVVGNTTAARVVSEANQGTVLVGVEVLGIGKLANTLLEADDVGLQEGKTLSLGEGWVDAGATLLNAVMAVT